MGATSSVISAQVRLTEAECRVLTAHLFDQAFFDASQESGTISLAALQAACGERTDVFLTHDWGHELGLDNHERIKRVNAALKARGLRTWFDEDKMEGNVKQKMVSGIEHASCIIVFVTKRYMDKVGGSNAEDNCFLEFNYASRRKTANKMVSVVMEERMRSTAEWTGILGLVLGGSLYVDLSNEEAFDAKMDELVARILAIIGCTLDQVLQSPEAEELIARKISELESSSLSSLQNSSKQPVTDSDQMLLANLSNWFVDNIQALRATADLYATTLTSAGIGSISKLTKKLAKDRAFLKQFAFDEDDIEDILTLLAPPQPVDERSKPTTPDGSHIRQPEVVQPAASPVVAMTAELKAEMEELKDFGFTLEQFLTKGYSVSQLRTFDWYTLNDFLINNISVADLRAAGYSDDELLNEMRVLDFPLAMLLDLGFTIHQLKSFNALSDFLLRGCNISDLVASGYTLAEFKEAGCSAAVLRATGIDTATLLAAGYQKSEVFTVAEVRAKGLTLAQLVPLGFTSLQLFQAGCSIAELKEAGFTTPQLKAAGIFMPSDVALVRTITAGPEITCLCLLRDGHNLLAAGDDKIVRMWDVNKTGSKCIRTFQGHTNWINCLADLSDDRPQIFVSGGEDKSLRVWDIANGNCVSCFTHHTRGVRCVALVSSERGEIIAGGSDTLLVISNYRTNKTVRTLVGHSEIVSDVCVLPGGDRAVSGSNDKKILLWDLTTGQCKRTIEDNAGRGVLCLALVSPDTVVSGGKDKLLKLWSLKTGELISTYEGHKDGIGCVAVVMDQWIVSCSRDKTVRLWEIDTRKCVGVLTGHDNFALALAAHPLGKVIVSGSKDKSIKVWS